MNLNKKESELFQNTMVWRIEDQFPKKSQYRSEIVLELIKLQLLMLIPKITDTGTDDCFGINKVTDTNPHPVPPPFFVGLFGLISQAFCA